MSYFDSFEDALDEFVSDVIVEDGCPVVPGSDDWSVFRDHDGNGFYLSSIRDDYRDVCMVSAYVVGELAFNGDCDFESDDVEAARDWLYSEIIEHNKCREEDDE